MRVSLTNTPKMCVFFLSIDFEPKPKPFNIYLLAINNFVVSK